jgi:hypothetical protein
MGGEELLGQGGGEVADPTRRSGHNNLLHVLPRRVHITALRRKQYWELTVQSHPRRWRSGGGARWRGPIPAAVGLSGPAAEECGTDAELMEEEPGWCNTHLLQIIKFCQISSALGCISK